MISNLEQLGQLAKLANWESTLKTFSESQVSAIFLLAQTIFSSRKQAQELSEGKICSAIKIKLKDETHLFLCAFINGPFREIFNAANLNSLKISAFNSSLARSVENHPNVIPHQIEHPFSKEQLKEINDRIIPESILKVKLKRNFEECQKYQELNTNEEKPSEKTPKRRCIKKDEKKHIIDVWSQFGSLSKGVVGFSHSYPKDCKNKLQQYLFKQILLKDSNTDIKVNIFGLLKAASNTSCASFFKDKITSLFIETLNYSNSPSQFLNDQERVYNLISQAFLIANEDYSKTLINMKKKSSKGCSLLFTCQYEKSWWIANCGETIAIRIQSGSPHVLAYPKKNLSSKKSASEIDKTFAALTRKIFTVWDGSGWTPTMRYREIHPTESGLTHMLGFGDETGIRARPIISNFDVENGNSDNDYLIIADITLANYMSLQRLSQIVQPVDNEKLQSSEISLRIIKEVKSLGCDEELSVLVINLQPNHS